MIVKIKDIQILNSNTYIYIFAYGVHNWRKSENQDSFRLSKNGKW